jgi:hypothetical protein
LEKERRPRVSFKGWHEIRTGQRTFSQLLELLLLAKARLFSQNTDREDVIARDALVAAHGVDIADVLDRKVLSDRTSSISQEGMCRSERLSRQEGVKEVVEGALQDGCRSDVGRERLVVACGRSVERFDGSSRIDASRARVLYGSNIINAFAGVTRASRTLGKGLTRSRGSTLF